MKNKLYILIGVVLLSLTAFGAGSILKGSKLVVPLISLTPTTVPGSCTSGSGELRMGTDNRLKTCDSTFGIFRDTTPKFAAGAFNCTASPTVITTTGNVTYSVTRVSGGTCRINFSGFVAAPTCVCTGYNLTNNYFCLNTAGAGASTTGVTWTGSIDGGGLVDSTFSFVCIGQ